MNLEAAPFVYRNCRPTPDSEEGRRQRAFIEEQYPNGCSDSSVEQILQALTGFITSFELLWCFDGGQVVGVLAYKEYTSNNQRHIFLHNFAVLPSHQRRGIGATLLEQVKDIARKQRLPLHARGINEVAIPRLVNAGFREVGTFRNRRFKWSDRPEHQNNESPWPNDDDC